MSEPHDHDHDHGPGHGHDHDHDHDHGHSHGPGHSHDHGPGDLSSVPASARSGPAEPPSVEPTDDPGTRALADALGSSFVIVKAIMVVLVLIFFGSGMFIVEQNQNAIVLHFGEPKGEGASRLYPPGWHWAWPYPIDEVVKVPRGLIHSVNSSVGWYSVTPAQEAAGTEPAAQASLNPATEGYTLTSDGNIMHARAVVRYSITDPVRYAFDFVETSNLVQNAVNNALIYASMRYDVDRATRLDKTGFRELVLDRVAALVGQENLGVDIDLKNSSVETRVPRQVKEAFDAVLAADLDRQKMISEAQGKTNEMLSKAKGEAEAVLSGARADATRIITLAEGDASSFQNQLPLYLANPRLFRERRTVEAMQRALTNSQANFVLQDPAGRNVELRLLLNREPPKPPPATPQP